MLFYSYRSVLIVLDVNITPSTISLCLASRDFYTVLCVPQRRPLANKTDSHAHSCDLHNDAIWPRYMTSHLEEVASLAR